MAEKEEFKTFDYLKFPLAVLVVYLHGHITNTTVGGTSFNYNVVNYPFYGNISYIISELIGYLAVPTFFVISGYLFFNGLLEKGRIMDKEKYVGKLSRRCKTLLVPFVLWNILYLGIFWGGQVLFPGLMSGNNRLISDYGVFDFLNAFWAGNDGFPIDSPLWFIRDIIVMQVLAPVFCVLFRYTKFFPLVLIGFLWILGAKTNITGLDLKSMLFFYGGGYLGYYQKPLINTLKNGRNWWFSGYAFCLIVSLLCLNKMIDGSTFWNYVNRISFVLGVPVILLLGNKLIEQREWTGTMEFLKDSNFFIFAFHILPLSFVTKVLLNTIVPQAEVSIFIVYIVSPIITILIGLIVFALLKKFLPKITSVLTGGRF